MPSAVKSLAPVREDMAPEDVKTLLAEMNTTPENLKRDAAALREWVNGQPHLPDLTSEYDEWLETFLMTAKNSMEKAKTRLDNYFTMRTALGDWFVMPPPPEDQLIVHEKEFFLNGWAPRLLPNGLILLMERAVIPADGNWSRVDMRTHYQRVVMQVDAMVGLSKKYRGAVLLMDEKNVNLGIITTFLASLANFRKTMNCVQDCMPIRLHSIHLVNPVAPSMQKMILNGITPFLKGKLAQRIHIHDDMKSLHQHIPAEYLPKEYGGTSESLEEYTTTLSNFIEASKDWYASRTGLKTDEDRRLEKRTNPADFGIEGSFRKLSVD